MSILDEVEEGVRLEEFDGFEGAEGQGELRDGRDVDAVRQVAHIDGAGWPGRQWPVGVRTTDDPTTADPTTTEHAAAAASYHRSCAHHRTRTHERAGDAQADGRAGAAPAGADATRSTLSDGGAGRLLRSGEGHCEVLLGV